jgi:hypothetical protein
VVSVASEFGLGLGAVVDVDSAGALEAAVSVVVVDTKLVVVLAPLAGGRELLAALTALWESPPQAPSPTAATTTSAVMWRIVGVPTAGIYAPQARGDCRGSARSSVR